MNITPLDTSPDALFTLTGGVGADEVPALRRALVSAVERMPSPVLVDARGVTAFPDAAMEALVVARSRAKFLRKVLVVVDGDPGIVHAALVRTGLVFRIPVFADEETARAVLAAEVSRREHLSLAAPRAEADGHHESAELNLANPHRRVVA
ncbi:MAG: STAS domain-containing protein [Actinobacteria bacterium]|nr:STAS domain-containing protein [Actinomycetota bacterium]